jgi:hypothetical protein
MMRFGAPCRASGHYSLAMQERWTTSEPRFQGQFSTVAARGGPDRARQYRLFMPSGAHKCFGWASGPELSAAKLR